MYPLKTYGDLRSRLENVGRHFCKNIWTTFSKTGPAELLLHRHMYDGILTRYVVHLEHIHIYDIYDMATCALAACSRTQHLISDEQIYHFISPEQNCAYHNTPLSLDDF